MGRTLFIHLSALLLLLSYRKSPLLPALALNRRLLHISTPFPGPNCRLKTQIWKDSTIYPEEFTKIHPVMLTQKSPPFHPPSWRMLSKFGSPNGPGPGGFCTPVRIMNRGAVRDTEITPQSCPASTQQAADARSILRSSSPVCPQEAQMHDRISQTRIHPTTYNRHKLRKLLCEASSSPH